MDKIQEIMDLIQEKMDECDELIAEIAELRYNLGDILMAFKEKSSAVSKQNIAS